MTDPPRPLSRRGSKRVATPTTAIASAAAFGESPASGHDRDGSCRRKTERLLSTTTATRQPPAPPTPQEPGWAARGHERGCPSRAGGRTSRDRGTRVRYRRRRRGTCLTLASQEGSPRPPAR